MMCDVSEGNPWDGELNWYGYSFLRRLGQVSALRVFKRMYAAKHGK